jgi:hypothetical protein
MNLYDKITASDSKLLRFYSRVMAILRYSLLTVRDVSKKEITEFPNEIFYSKQNTSASTNASQREKCETPGEFLLHSYSTLLRSYSTDTPLYSSPIPLTLHSTPLLLQRYSTLLRAYFACTPKLFWSRWNHAFPP